MHVFHSLHDFACFNELNFCIFHLRVPSFLHIRGQLLITGFPGAASTACDTHSPAEQTSDDGTQTALHLRSATPTGERPTIGSAAGPRPTGAAVTCLGRQFRVSAAARTFPTFTSPSTSILSSSPPHTFLPRVIASPPMHACTHTFVLPILVKLVVVNAYCIYFFFSLLHKNSHSQHYATLAVHVIYTMKLMQRS